MKTGILRNILRQERYRDLRPKCMGPPLAQQIQYFTTIILAVDQLILLLRPNYPALLLSKLDFTALLSKHIRNALHLCPFQIVQHIMALK